MTEVTRRTLVVGLGGAAAAAGVAAGPAVAQRGARAVGAPRREGTGLEIVGTIVQEGIALDGFGFLTYISGLAERALFTSGTGGPDRSEQNARFTFASDVRITARSVRPELFTVSGRGDLRIYFQPSGGASFDNPGSFAGGTRIATYRARFQNVLSVIGPDQAVMNLTGELTQRQARAFRLGGRSYRLGRTRLRLRLEASGPGRRSEPTIPRATFQVGGAIVVPD